MRTAFSVSAIAVTALCCWCGIIRSKSAVSVRNVATSTLSNNNSNHSIVLFTYVFTKSAAEKRYLRLFLETAATSGVDVIVIGDIPTHGHHVQVTWNELCDRVQHNVLDGHDPKRLRTAPDAYKIIDFKPLTAALFPELVKDYAFWGHADNDMLLGSVLSTVQRLLDDYDVISGIPDHPTWGPFTLFRNQVSVNYLFKETKVDLRDLFDTEKPVCFDEWGQCSKKRGGDRSMSAIIDSLQDNGASGIRVYREGLSLTWDGVCKFRALGGTQDPQCATCDYRNGTLRTRNKNGEWHETLLCHYEYAKARLEASLENDEVYEGLLSAKKFAVNFREGFKPSQIPQINAEQNTDPQTAPIIVLPELRRDVSVKIPKITLGTYVFSGGAPTKEYLRLFVETAAKSGAESVWIIGDTVPPFALPPNVHHFTISWVELCTLVQEKLQIPVDRLKSAQPYKVNDLKPLFAYLFPDLVANADYWVTCDNDLLVGDLRQLWPRQGDFDVLSGSNDHSTWGPFTMYRNDQSIATLFQRGTISLERILNNEKPVCFDEWGSCGFRRWPGASMAGIVDDSGLRVAHASTGWDGWCQFPRFRKSKQRCAECVYKNGGLWLRDDEGSYEEVLVCHYQYSKSRLESSLQNTTLAAEMFSTGEFRTNYLEGVQPLNAP